MPNIFGAIIVDEQMTSQFFETGQEPIGKDQFVLGNGGSKSVCSFRALRSGQAGLARPATAGESCSFFLVPTSARANLTFSLAAHAGNVSARVKLVFVSFW